MINRIRRWWWSRDRSEDESKEMEDLAMEFALIRSERHQGNERIARDRPEMTLAEKVEVIKRHNYRVRNVFNLRESVKYKKALTVDQTTSIQGEYPPLGIDLLIDFRKTIPYIDTAVEFYKDVIIGNQIEFNCDDEEAKKILEVWCQKSNFHARLKNVIDMTLVTGLGLFLKQYSSDGKLQSIEDFDMSTIWRVARDKFGNAVEISQRLANSGIINHSTNDFVPIILRENFRQYYGRSVFSTLAEVSFTRGRMLPTLGDRILGMIDATMACVENFAFPPTFVSMEGLSRVAKKELLAKLKKRKPGDYLIGNALPEMKQMEVRTEATYDSFMQHFIKLVGHATGFPLELMEVAYGSRAASEVTDSMFMRKIYNYQTAIANIIVRDIFVNVLLDNKYTQEQIFDMGLSVTFKSHHPAKFTPEQVQARVSAGMWTIAEARAYDKNEGQDLFDDETIEKHEQMNEEMRQADLDMRKAGPPPDDSEPSQ